MPHPPTATPSVPARRRVGAHGAALLSLWGLLGLAGCAENVVTPSNLDLTGSRPTDLGGDSATPGAVAYSALIDDAPYLTYQPNQPAADQWRERPRDTTAAVFTDQTPARGQLYFAAAAKAGGSWVLGRLAVSDIAVPPLNGQTRGAEKLLTGQAGSWFAGDLLAPSASVGNKVRGRKVALYFAATGSTSFPDVDRVYVSQIGLMTSDDGVSFSPEPGPVLAPPAWNGQAPALPLTPDSHGVTDPSLVSFKNQLWLYYTGLSCDANLGCKFSVLRRSTNDGLTFGPLSVVKELQNIAEATGGVASPSALVVDGKLLLAYSLIKRQPSRGRDLVQQALLAGQIGLLTSDDGNSFTESTRALVTPRGDYAGGVGHPFLYQEGDKVRLLFNGAADVTQPGINSYRATLLRL